tara:strand:- start:541 stop:849 length:309 start_codon:yes stop_codon:yes gene_type:complete
MKITKSQLRRIIKEELKEAGRSQISPDSPDYRPPSEPPPWLGAASEIIKMIKAEQSWWVGTAEDSAAHAAGAGGDPDLVKFLTNYIWLYRMENVPTRGSEGQ